MMRCWFAYDCLPDRPHFEWGGFGALVWARDIKIARAKSIVACVNEYNIFRDDVSDTMRLYALPDAFKRNKPACLINDGTIPDRLMRMLMLTGLARRYWCAEYQESAWGVLMGKMHHEQTALNRGLV